jgi:hypothetical protein
MPKGGKRSRRNRKGSGIFCNDEKGASYFDRIKKSFSSWTTSQPPVPQYPSPVQNQNLQQPQNQSYLGGKRHKKRSMKRGGGPALPYNPATVWSNESPFPQAVGGRRTKRRGGSNPMPYGPEVWSNIGPFPQAVGGRKKRRTRRQRR